MRQTAKQMYMQLAGVSVADIVREVGLHEVAVAVLRIGDEPAPLSRCRYAGIEADALRLDGAAQAGGQLRQRFLELSDGKFSRHISP